MKSVLKGSRDSEVTATAAQTPKEIGVVLGTGSEELAVSRYEVHGRQIVAGKAILASEAAETSTERQPRGFLTAWEAGNLRSDPTRVAPGGALLASGFGSLTMRPKVSQAVWTAIQSALSGSKSVQDALNTAQGQISTILKG